MPREHLTEVHDRFVDAVCNIFVGISSKKNAFTISEAIIDGLGSATVISGSDRFEFDILMAQKNEDGRIHYCVECKTRRECSNSTSSDLRGHLDEFLKKAYKCIDSLESRYGQNYGFIFISDVPFEVWDNHINFEFVQRAIGNEPPSDHNKISKLHPKVKILVFSDWFADFFKEE